MIAMTFEDCKTHYNKVDFYPILFIIPFLNDNISLTKNAFVLAQFTRLGHSTKDEFQNVIIPNYRDL